MNKSVNIKRFIDTSEDSIAMYLKEVRKIDMLTPQEEVILAQKVKEGDRAASDRLIKANLRFVISVAKEYQGQGIPLVDLISDGNLGLIKAAEKFDPTRGFRFISYAVWWIKQSIIQGLNDNARTVRLPVNVTNNISKLKREIERFEQIEGRKPTEIDVKVEQTGETWDLTPLLQPSCSSLNASINEDGDELMDVIEDKMFDKPDEAFENPKDILKGELEKTLSILSPREKAIIELYFGLGGSPLTLEEIGDDYGLTKERIRQIKEKALRKLRNKSKNLFEFMYK
jgi:RNA polymerase primary sigma factor